MARLVYIDEQEAARNEMVRAVFISGHFEAHDIVVLDPSPDMADTIAEIEAHRPEALITDYVLSEHKAGVDYSGTELVQAYQAQRKAFPCFVTTGFAADAAGSAPLHVDVNSIYSKIESFQAPDPDAAPQSLPFFLRVKTKIEAHQAYIAFLESSLLALIEAGSNGSLSPSEAQKLLDIDDELEAMLGGTTRVPAAVKEQALAPLTAIVSKAQRLVADLEALYPDAEEAGGA